MKAQDLIKDVRAKGSPRTGPVVLRVARATRPEVLFTLPVVRNRAAPVVTRPAHGSARAVDVWLRRSPLVRRCAQGIRLAGRAALRPRATESVPVAGVWLLHSQLAQISVNL
jgi:hypothetical protein